VKTYANVNWLDWAKAQEKLFPFAYELLHILASLPANSVIFRSGFPSRFTTKQKPVEDLCLYAGAALAGAKVLALDGRVYRDADWAIFKNWIQRELGVPLSDLDNGTFLWKIFIEPHQWKILNRVGRVNLIYMDPTSEWTVYRERVPFAFPLTLLFSSVLRGPVALPIALSFREDLTEAVIKQKGKWRFTKVILNP